MDERKKAHLKIEGRVQGVGFRYFVRELAMRHGVNGWVRNLYDGSVEAVLEGDSKDVSIAVAYCYKGPPGSLVTNVDVTWMEYTGEFTSFGIRF
ncbi:MAG: acylphosphatase [Nitrospirae bacterium]|nr:acylphosphatase [Nitrospirota bacterium]